MIIEVSAADDLNAAIAVAKASGKPSRIFLTDDHDITDGLVPIDFSNLTIEALPGTRMIGHTRTPGKNLISVVPKATWTTTLAEVSARGDQSFVLADASQALEGRLLMIWQPIRTNDGSYHAWTCISPIIKDARTLGNNTVRLQERILFRAYQPGNPDIDPNATPGDPAAAIVTIVDPVVNFRLRGLELIGDDFQNGGASGQEMPVGAITCNGLLLSGARNALIEDVKIGGFEWGSGYTMGWGLTDTGQLAQPSPILFGGYGCIERDMKIVGCGTAIAAGRARNNASRCASDFVSSESSSGFSDRWEACTFCDDYVDAINGAGRGAKIASSLRNMFRARVTNCGHGNGTNFGFAAASQDNFAILDTSWAGGTVSTSGGEGYVTFGQRCSGNLVILRSQDNLGDDVAISSDDAGNVVIGKAAKVTNLGSASLHVDP